MSIAKFSKNFSQGADEERKRRPVPVGGAPGIRPPAAQLAGERRGVAPGVQPPRLRFSWPLEKTNGHWSKSNAQLGEKTASGTHLRGSEASAASRCAHRSAPSQALALALTLTPSPNPSPTPSPSPRAIPIPSPNRTARRRRRARMPPRWRSSPTTSKRRWGWRRRTARRASTRRSAGSTYVRARVRGRVKVTVRVKP